MRPGELAVVAQALGAPVGENVAAEGGEHVRAAAVATAFSSVNSPAAPMALSDVAFTFRGVSTDS